MTTINVKVEPGSEEFRVEEGTIPKIYLENEAEKGRANHELVTRLQEILGEKPGIVSGHRSRRKKLKFDMDKEEAIKRMKKHG